MFGDVMGFCFMAFLYNAGGGVHRVGVGHPLMILCVLMIPLAETPSVTLPETNIAPENGGFQ